MKMDTMNDGQVFGHTERPDYFEPNRRIVVTILQSFSVDAENNNHVVVARD